MENKKDTVGNATESDWRNAVWKSLITLLYGQQVMLAMVLGISPNKECFDQATKHIDAIKDFAEKMAQCLDLECEENDKD